MMNMNLKKGVIGIAAVMVLMLGTIIAANTHAAPVNSGASIGYVDYQQVISSSVDYKNAQSTFAVEAEKIQKEYEQAAAGLNDSEKQQLASQYMKRIEQKRLELQSQADSKVSAVIKDVATAQGIAVVLDKNGVFYGGKDLTQDVVTKLGK
jgi:outer membrane protein